MKRLLIAALLGSLLVVVAPAHAAVQCEVVATGLPGTYSACEYTATGPGQYVVATASGFSVSILRGVPAVWQTIATNAGAAATTGAIPSSEGERVRIGIGIAPIQFHGIPVATIQDGTISAIE